MPSTWSLLTYLRILLSLVNSLPAEDNLKLNDFQRSSELVFVNVMFRHGDRSPILQNPGDKYGVKYWPDGWGQLSNIGKKQHYKLGTFFRKRYKNFLSKKFHVNETYVQSSDVDRTMMSAQANLAGLYPPEIYPAWNPLLSWQLIPIHTQKVDTDYLVVSDVPTSCAAYYNSFNRYLESADMKAFQKSTKSLYELLSTNTGVPVTYYYDYWNLSAVRDTWVCENAHNLNLPEWSHELFPKNESFYQATLKYYYLSSATKFLSKFSSGFLLKDMLDRFTSKSNKTLSPDRKLWMYSTHDNNLFSFLNSLGISDNKFVPYAAAIMVELRRYKYNHYVQIFYKNSEEIPDAIEIPGCGKACPLSKMYEIYGDIIPKNDFNIECGIDEM